MSKSKELLTPSAFQVTKRLKQDGWKQKEYLSAGVIALDQANPKQKILYKSMAYNNSLWRITEFKRLFCSMNKDEQRNAITEINAITSPELSITDAAQAVTAVARDTTKKKRTPKKPPPSETG